MVFSCQEKGTGAPYAAKILKKTVSGAGEGLGRAGGVSAPLPLSTGHRSHDLGLPHGQKRWDLGWGEPWDRQGNVLGVMGGVSAWWGAGARPGSAGDTSSVWALLPRSTKRS